jgi:hypothetical protein
MPVSWVAAVGSSHIVTEVMPHYIAAVPRLV